MNRPLSTSVPVRKIITKEKVLSFLLVTSFIAVAYVLQDKKRKRHPVILKKTSEKAIIYKLPKSVPYLIIGGGTAAHAAARAIRAADANNRVLIVGDETYFPYMRPPLSKELWFTDDPAKVSNLVFNSFSGRSSDLFWEEDGYYCSPEELMSLKHGGTAVALGLKATQIDTQEQVVSFKDGQKVKYDKCLLATGSRPKGVEALKKSCKNVKDRTLQLRTIDDFKRLLRVSRYADSVAVVGEDLLATEISCALANKALGKNRLKVSHILADDTVLASLLPSYLSKWATSQIRKEGVRLVTGRQVVSSRYDWFADQVVLKLSDGSEVRADYVLEAAGLEANVDLAKGTDIKLDTKLGGFLADEKLKVAKNLWVAGDAASFVDSTYGRRRLEHHNNAFFTGRLAGQNMCGEDKGYWLQQTFWADLGSQSAFQAVGIVDSSLPTVAVFTNKQVSEGQTPAKPVNDAEKKDLVDGKGADGEVGKKDNGGVVHKAEEIKTSQVSAKPASNAISSLQTQPPKEEYNKGVLFYLKDDVVVGVLLWNVFNADQTAKDVLHQQSSFPDYAELAKLFKLYDPAGPDD